MTNTAYVELGALAGDLASARSPTVRAAASDPPGAVELTSVAQRLGGRWALRGVTIRVEPGEVVAIAGANGSGKTTLLRVVATTLTPTRGSGRVFGHDLVREADAVRAVVGMLGHATGLYDDLSAAENLAFALRMYGVAPTARGIDAALEAVEMREHAQDLVRRLSAGMRRRVALARLWLRRPRLLLLDEPYNSFDAAGVEVVDALVRDTARTGGAALVVTHDLARSAGVAYDRVIFLNAGRISGDPVRGPEAVS
ncbi:MAG: heme ABC exporter ATP-binding protein CcmA [Gemmatimonadaceae bacterium]